MKILVLSSLAYSLTNFRGALLASMVAAGHEVVACAPDDDAEVAAALAMMGISFRTVRMARAGTNPLSDLATLIDMTRLMRRERPDLVLAYTQKPIIYGGIAARLLGIRSLAMCSGLGHAFSDNQGPGARMLRTIVSKLYRLAVSKAEAVFVFNRDDEGEMLRHGIVRRGQRIIQVPGSGIDTAVFEKLPVPEGPPVFLMIARLLRDKGLGEYAAAARVVRAACPEARFQLLGPLDANPSSISAAELESWQAEGLVEYLGETKDVRPHLAAASVFVLPTYYREGLPRTILEAMATGRAIVTTDTPGCRETVLAGQNGFLVKPRDAGSLADALLKFTTDRELAARFGAASRAIAEDRFDVRKVNAQLLEVMTPEEKPSFAAPENGGSRRAVDFVAAALGLILLCPLMTFAALVALGGVGRPVLFRQMRAGRNGHPFCLNKFRTMTNALGLDGLPLPDEARVTPVGRLLRRTRLDELPQLWNVLRGDMSLFGPRPLLPETIVELGDAGRARCAVRPGLTGWAQVHGGPLLTQEDKLALDLWYVQNRTAMLDMSIIVRTLAVLVRDDRVVHPIVGRAHASLGRWRG